MIAAALGIVLGGVLGLAADAARADALHGEAIVKRECVSCHDVVGPAPATLEGVQNRKAPDLFYAGSKFIRSWLVEWLRAPTPIRPAGMMYLNHIVTEDGLDMIAENSVKPCPAKLSPATAGKVADYLMTLKDPAMKTGLIDPGKKFSKAKALRLFRNKLPCIGCHTIKRGRRTMGGVSGPNLTEAGNRLDPDWVYAKIENPQHWDPKTWMPRLEMSHGKREMLTLFIGGMRQRPETKPEIKRPDIIQVGLAVPPGVPRKPAIARNDAAGDRYRHYCVQCHGTKSTGRGINETSGGLAVSPRYHTSSDEMNKLSDEELRRAITEGGAAVGLSALMPAWGETFSAAEIGELVVHLRKLCKCEGKK